MYQILLKHIILSLNYMVFELENYKNIFYCYEMCMNVCVLVKMSYNMGKYEWIDCVFDEFMLIKTQK